MPPPDRRIVLRDEGFEPTLQPLFSDWLDAESYIAGAEEILALDATVGMPLGDGTWILPMAPVRGAEIWLYYIMYDTVVVLMQAKAFVT